MRACAEGGSRVMEFTNRGEKALPVFIGLSDFIESQKVPMVLGVGSVQDAPTAALYIAYGANFIVSPSFNPEVARLCNRRKIAYMPG
ncbi:MAG: bifunctional 4-hydroxy-2-oxoglutarate aldolase/2-dehydro-3-deoxy-phosphogluconate aldolase, partial [Bacteroidales bacterium]|nr:bifunctional 4-hydroxy-2-oxoglutarate aldolase/2-dehydro-3-deoxy-phosphogluconate aldolase [Bacteroidales bacterium]